MDAMHTQPALAGPAHGIGPADRFADRFPGPRRPFGHLAGRLGRGFVIEIGQDALLDARADNAVDGAQNRVIVRGHQVEGLAAAFGPTGSADAMDIGIRGGGDIEVDHMRDIGDIDAPGRDVGGHQDLKFSRAKTVQGRLAPCLGKVALQGGGPIARLGQNFAQALGALLGAGKDQHRSDLGILQNPEQQRGLQVLGDREMAAARELTKVYEQFVRGSISQVKAYFAENEPRGEFVLVVGGQSPAAPSQWTKTEVLSAIQAGLQAGKKSKELAAELAEPSGWSKKELYALVSGAK